MRVGCFKIVAACHIARGKRQRGGVGIDALVGEVVEEGGGVAGVGWGRSSWFHVG